jgi:selenium metabolism protein YedF
MADVILINNEFFGKGSDELGKKLMGAFLRKIWSQQKKPDSIILYNSAVKLITEGSDCLDAMYGLEESGIDIIACGTCVEFFDLKNSIKVGRISDMDEISITLMQAAKVITI